MSRTVRIFDTTLRDGEQTPGVHITPDQKVAIAHRLKAIGVTTIEAGFPISSPGDRDAVARIASEVRGCEIAAMARCVAQDIDAAAEALRDAERPVVHVFLGTSDIHLTKKLRLDRAGAVRAIRECVARARRHVADVQFSAEDATRTERPFLRQCIAAAVESGATRINLPDTVGCMLPREYGEMIRDVVRFVGPHVIVSAHCHNDMGMATANTVAAVEGGARQVEVTVNGIGERAGNAALEEVAVAMAMKRIAESGVDVQQVTALSAHVAEVTRVPVQPNRAVVGANAFAHSSGIHQDGILKDPSTYEFVPPAMVGAPGHRFVMTSRSGRGAVAHHAARMGYRLTDAQVDEVYRAFIEVAAYSDGAVDADELARVIGAACGPPPNPTQELPPRDDPKRCRFEEVMLL
ncbi:MAG TPA: 2-isopropylmalate synthase [Candidatus Hydrogenedentes bacterium]|nr:2-isopropylmalate synthase [Candidatus Hydrogenedentota bacterium]